METVTTAKIFANEKRNGLGRKRRGAHGRRLQVNTEKAYDENADVWRHDDGRGEERTKAGKDGVSCGKIVTKLYKNRCDLGRDGGGGWVKVCSWRPRSCLRVNIYICIYAKKVGDVKRREIARRKRNNASFELADRAFLLGRRLLGDGHTLVYLTYEFQEYLIYVDPRFGASLHKKTIPGSRQILALLPAHNPLRVQIAFVAHQHQWNLLSILHAQDLVVEVGEVIEGGLGGHGVAEDETLTIFHVEVTHCRKLLRARGVQNLQHALLAVDINLLSVAIFDRWIVLLNENILNELDREGTLADTSATKDDQLVLAHLVCRQDPGKPI
uniref:Uncharacterized protein n=1 Tax=Schistocephalus solidus TaxID=70667 RepID=A0A0V0J169_SCHSO